jgi:hypothetical protein
MTIGRPDVRLCCCFFALYALTSSGNAFRVPDEFEVYFQAEHLVDAGDISIPQTLAVTQGGQPIFFGKFGLDGRPYAPYGPGVAFLIVPFHVAGRLVAHVAGVPRRPPPDGIAWEFLVGGITTLAMAFAAALAVAGGYRASRALGGRIDRSFGIALILGGGTMLWPYGTTLYSEAWLAAAFAWAAALIIEARCDASNARARVAGAAVLLALAGLAKPTALVIAPGFVVAALCDPHVDRATRWRAAIALSVGIGIGALAQIGWNLARFGHPLDFGYNLGGMIPIPPARAFTVEEIPRGLFVQVLTPGKSLFVWAPPVLVSLLVLRTCWSREPGLVAGLITATVAALVFYAAFLFPEGGYAHGPRHLVPLVPLLILPLAIPGVTIRRRVLAACAVAGFLVSALAVSISFLEDQAPLQADPRATGPYYERIDPPPGRPWLRYRIDYVPFKTALSSGHWLASNRPAGNGPDFFALHLARARESMPGGAAIPVWLPWAVSMPWVGVLVLAGWRLSPLFAKKGGCPLFWLRPLVRAGWRGREKRR